MKGSHVRRLIFLFQISLLAFSSPLWAKEEQVVDVPSRPGVTQRMVVLAPDQPNAAVVLFAGGNGGLQIDSSGDIKKLGGNFLVRTRSLFASKGLMVAVVDAPSDRQDPPFLAGFRQTTEHVADIKAVIAWLKHKSNIPVWLVGTSRGTQSVAYISTQLAPADGGPDGIVLTSTILSDKKGRPVTEMPLGRINVPTLVVHHRNDGCNLCRPEELPRLTEKLTAVPRKELLMFEGGEDKGDPCEAAGHHGFAGIEQDVVAKITEWITWKNTR